MSYTFARPLDNHIRVESFLEHCIGIERDHALLTQHKISFAQLAVKIRDVQSALHVTNAEPTSTSSSNRVEEYRDDRARKGLRKRILEELITLDRLDDDELIKLGTGGAKPVGAKPRANSQAFIIIGLPASGKSTLVNLTADKLGAIIIDSDFAKRKLPEFELSPAGAYLVHDESNEIVLGGAGAPSLIEFCTSYKTNMVIPKIGHSYKKIVALAQDLKDKGYAVHLTATLLSRQESALRATNRFLSTGRYVPLNLIFDGYANDPLMNFYRFQYEEPGAKGLWESIGSIDTTNGNRTIHYTKKTNPAFLLTEV